MLVLVSDLHMSDGSAGPRNITIEAYEGALEDIARHAGSAGATDVYLVFLGDTFDLIRTTKWFRDTSIHPSEKPWGANPTEGAALKVLEGILGEKWNKPVLDTVLSKPMVGKYGFTVEPHRVYIPGNHDRLCGMYPSLRKLVAEKLGVSHLDCQTPVTSEELAAEGARFRHWLLDPAHGIIARHGHEYDSFNFEGSQAFSGLVWKPIPDADYEQTPIGDPITCEIYSKLPDAVVNCLPPGHASGEDLRNRLLEVFDVRPLAAVPAWLAYQVKQFGRKAVTDAINTGVHQVVEEFKELPFYHQWLRKHDNLLNPFDAASVLSAVLCLMDALRFTTAEKVFPLVEKIVSMRGSDNLATEANQELELLESAGTKDILYVAYGHTHAPEQRPLFVRGSPPDDRARVYLNTGMWRPSHTQGLEGGFTSWKNLTYTIVYQPGEKVSKDAVLTYPAFETWSGTLKDA